MSSSALIAPDLSSGVFTDTASPDVAVSVRGLSKSYSITKNAVQHTSAGEAIMHRLRHPFEKTERDTFWALNDVNFDIQKGDVVGIIGRNGAGKSTLLKILSRITEPTKGKIDLYGRVGSLLEVGTGFHPELTGRENIFLNGAILGMTKGEITRQFDAIVDFSGTAQFLDTPVKRYSSGMYVRLAFAVAAHLNPEILIVDEVLAVGDAEFQKKCLGKMQNVSESGRTVILVSHQMQSVSALCTKAFMLRHGKMTFDGAVDEAIDRYLASYSAGATEEEDASRRLGSGEYRFASVLPAKQVFQSAEGKAFGFTVDRISSRIDGLYLSAHVVSSAGTVIAQCDSRLMGQWLGHGAALTGEFEFTSPWLKPGDYRLDMFLCHSGGIVDSYDNACQFEVSPVLPYSHTLPPDGTEAGLVFSDFTWKL